MAAVRRAPKSTSGGSGRGTEPSNARRFIVRGRVHRQPANDNAPIHGGREALCLYHIPVIRTHRRAADVIGICQSPSVLLIGNWYYPG